MKVVICGAGQVGFNIARYLAAANNDVTVIDQRRDLTQKISESLDLQAVTGHASHPDTLEGAGAADADLIIAVTMYDEVNMVACQVAHTLFNVPTKIARVRDQSYLQARWQDLFRRDHLPIDVIISPEVEVAHAIARRLEVPGALDVISFANDKVRLIAVRCDRTCPILDTPLRQLTYLFPDLHVVCVGISRDDHFFVPTGDDQILVGDEVHFVVETTQIGRVMPVFGHEEHMSERVIVAGGGNIGLYLTRELEERLPNVSIKVVEGNAERAEYVADNVKRSIVLHGDARDREILEEANARAAQAIVTVTNDDEVNIMAALLAKRLGCQHAFALVNNNAYPPILGGLGIDVAVNPRETTVSSVLRHVRRGRIKSVYSVHDGEAEVYEAEALETSPLVGQPLREARLPGGLLVGAVVRGDEVITPRGGTVVRAKDRVIMTASKEMVKKVEKMFAVRLDYF